MVISKTKTGHFYIQTTGGELTTALFRTEDGARNAEKHLSPQQIKDLELCNPGQVLTDAMVNKKIRKVIGG